MDLVAKVFLILYALLCKYNVTKNVRSRLKPTVCTKQINDEDGKMVKPGMSSEKIVDACNNIINYSKEELYVESIIYFRRVCVRYPYFMKYIESAILDQVKKKIGCAWTDQVRHFGNGKIIRVESAHATQKN